MTSDGGDGPARPATAPRAEPAARAPIGLLLQGRFRIVGELGAGAFGPVCLGDDEATGHRVAVRLLPRGLAGALQAAQAVQRLRRSIVAASPHPGLVRVLEIGEAEPDRLFTVTELVKGRRLSEMGRPIPVGDALRLALDIGGCVETLHKAGLVHGALRPRNVRVLDDGRVKLMDVELAGLRDVRAPAGPVAAPPPEEYLSPEQISLAPVSDKTDVYAFAAILYELLSGAPPFQAVTREAVLAKHLVESPAPIRRWQRAVPASVEHLITQALDKHPERRPRMQAVLNVLRAEVTGRAVRWTRTAVVVAGAALTGSLAVSITLGVLALRPWAQQPSEPPAVVEQAPESPPPAPAVPPHRGPAAASPRAAPAEREPAPVPKVTAPAARPPLSLPPRPERRNEPRAPAGAALERPASSEEEAQDPGAVIDWLLKR